MNLTIISPIDNNMDDELESICRDYLKWSAGDTPIISVSQKPVKLGTNICIGEIGRSIESFWMQLLLGAKRAKTKWVAIAEQDNFYPKGYFDYRPSKEDVFYYNFNCIILHYSGSLHGRFGINNEIRTASSTLICGRQVLVDALSWVIGMLDEGYTLGEEGFICEPGAWVKLFKEEYTVPEEFLLYDFFWDTWPTIDMRHDKNFTRQKRQYKILSDKIVYWGTLADILARKPMTNPCIELICYGL